ncbi:hypothetical protein GCM10028817_22150 [Spirosoma pomorum]
MNDTLKKGRTLQLDGLAAAPVKVTIGFKCDGRAKIRLAQEAHQAEMTLSEYVEHVVSLRHEQPPAVAPVVDQSPQLLDQLRQARQQLAVYEQNETLQRALATSKGQTIQWKDATGQLRSLLVNQVSDVFTILVSSVDISQ